MSRRRQLFLFVALPLLVCFSVLTYLLLGDRSSKSAVNSGPAATDSPQESAVSTLEFSHELFDLTLIDRITPLGEVNGGYEEAQAISGVMIWNKPDAVTENKFVDVYAPTSMTLEGYSYHTDPISQETGWTLIFQIQPNISMRIDHLTDASAEIKAVTTSTPKSSSAEEQPTKRLKIQAGQVIAKTQGTKLAKNWNVYMFDTSHKNQFINQARYEQSQVGRRLLNAVCPFDFYKTSDKSALQSKFGTLKPGETDSCGNASKDKAGTAAGMWHFSQTTETELREQLDGHYASPLSIYRNSAGQVIIDQLAGQRFDLDNAKDPAEITDSHCYALVNNQRLAAGYAYLKLINANELKLNYSSQGGCPSQFPAQGEKSYYR